MASSYYWPLSLPQNPMRTGYKYGWANNTITSNMEYGPPKTRRRSSAGMNSLQVSFIFDTEQLQIFKDFYLVAEGISFYLPDPENPQANYLLVKISPAGDDRSFDYIPYGLEHWRVDLNLKVWPHASIPRQ
jgi:hypothetical protein